MSSERRPRFFLTLPPELISLIFISYQQLLNLSSNFLDGEHDLDNHMCSPFDPLPGPKGNGIREILLLGSISRYLRTIAWTTPQLWSHIAICLSDAPSRSNAQITGLTSWLERSGGFPVSIRLQCFTVQQEELVETHPSSPSEGFLAPLAAMQSIRTHSSHWEELCLGLPSECYVLFFDHARTHTMPLLKRLTFLFHNAWPTSSLYPARPLTGVPALTDISLINMPSRNSMLALPWGQTTRFRGSRLQLADVLDVLDIAPLKACSLTWVLGYPTVDAAVSHAHLRSLTLEGNVTALKYLTLPALEILCIRTHRAFPTEQCIQLLLRSGCTLKSLEISVGFIVATALVSCLEATPGLRELKIHNQKDSIHSLFGDFMLERMTLKDRDRATMLVPWLWHLEVLGCSCMFHVETLGRMLQSRWVCADGKAGMGTGTEADSGRLECFRLEASRDAFPTMWKDVGRSPLVSKLLEAGMDIRVRPSA